MIRSLEREDGSSITGRDAIAGELMDFFRSKWAVVDVLNEDRDLSLLRIIFF